MKTARILALRSKHRLAELPPRIPVGSCLTHGLEVCTIARLIDSTLRGPARSEHSILYLYIGVAAGGLWALRGGFFVQVSVVIQMCEAFTKAINGTNYFWHG
jgi:hypothetical protein